LNRKSFFRRGGAHQGYPQAAIPPPIHLRDIMWDAQGFAQPERPDENVATFDLGVWIIGALFTAFALVSSLKRATERMTLCILRRLKQQQLRRFAALTSR
jgi:tellurite resistance protein TehA-like permease